MNRPKINDKDYNLLFDACDSGNVKLIRAVCDYDIINHQNENGYTLLSIACMRNDILMIKSLLKFLPDTNIKTNDGFSPLMFAIKNNNLETVKLLIENGANVNDQKGIGSSLMYACSYGFYEIIDLLISNNAKLNTVDGDKNNLLMIASKEGYLKIAKYLIGKNINVNEVNKIGNNALMFAILSNNIDIVKLLIKNDVDINWYNKEGVTALMLAVQQKRYNIIELLLLNKKLDINKIDYDGFTALMYACLIEDIKSVAFLLGNKKTNINKSNHSNETALMIAIKKDNEEITTLLLAKLADINIKNINGNNALKLAALNGNFNIVKILISYSENNYDVYDKDLIEAYKKTILEFEKEIIDKKIQDKSNLYEKLEEEGNINLLMNSKDIIINDFQNINNNLDLVPTNDFLEKVNVEEIDITKKEIMQEVNNNTELILEINKNNFDPLDLKESKDQKEIMESIDFSIEKLFKNINDKNSIQKKFDQEWLDLNIKEQRSILDDKNSTILEKMEKWIKFVQKTKVEWSPYDRYFGDNELIIIDNNNLEINEERYRNKIFAYWEKIKNKEEV